MPVAYDELEDESVVDVLTELVKLLLCSVELKGEELDVVELTVVLEEVPVRDTKIDEDTDDTLDIVLIALVELLLLAIKLDEDDKVEKTPVEKTPVELESVLSAVLVDALPADTKFDEYDTLEVRLVELVQDMELDDIGLNMVQVVDETTEVEDVPDELARPPLVDIEPLDDELEDEAKRFDDEAIEHEIGVEELEDIKLDEEAIDFEVEELEDAELDELVKPNELDTEMPDVEELDVKLPACIDVVELKDKVVLLMVDEIEPAVEVLRIVAVLAEDNVAALLKVLGTMDTDEIDCMLESVDVDPVIGPETPVGVVHAGGGACMVRFVQSSPRGTWFWGIVFREAECPHQLLCSVY
jgi:hypothetical protein